MKVSQISQKVGSTLEHLSWNLKNPEEWLFREKISCRMSSLELKLDVLLPCHIGQSIHRYLELFTVFEHNVLIKRD